MTNTKIIIVKEKRETRTWCDGCAYFRVGLLHYLIGFGNARCSYEGRIIEKQTWTMGFWAFNPGWFESDFLIPHWCPLPNESTGVIP
jgi:hypothetical protein